MSPVAFKPLPTVGKTILAYREKHKNSSCEEILAFVKKHFPHNKTTLASVASTLSHAGVAPGRSMAKADELPSFKPEAEHEPEETEQQARERISVRYDAMERMVPRVVAGKLPSIIISGPPGVGKSYTTLRAIEQSGRARHDGLENVGGGGPSYQDNEQVTAGWYDQIQGTITAVGLYHALWNMRNGGVLFLDDCDAVFRDEDSLNLLKVATDSTRERLVSWRKHASWLDEFEIDKTFDFRGHIIFLTNIDFEEVIRRGHKDSEHFKALIDRAAYLCLTLRTARDFMIRISDVAGGPNGFLRHEPYGLTVAQSDELLKYVRDNQRQFYNLSLRLVGQIALMMKADPDSWKIDTAATKMRTI